MNLKESYENHKKAGDRYFKRQEKIDNKIEELKKKRERLRYPSHLHTWFAPYAEKLKKMLKAKCYDWYGPFGLCCESTIYFLKESGDICKKGNVLGSICFVDGGSALRDESKNTKRFARGTIGEMNGMNNPSVPVTKEMNVNWLYMWAKRRR